MTAASNPKEFLLARVSKDGPAGCWIWQKACLPDGYGHCRVNGRTVRTHRVSYEAFIGPIPAGMHVLHKCDVPACVNPDHLFLGTHQDNMRDAAKKQRHYMQRHPEKSTLRNHEWRGEKSPRAKLTDAQAAEIKESRAKIREICERYGISKATVDRIRAGNRGIPSAKHNRPGSKAGINGHPGVSPSGDRWVAYTTGGGKQRYLGSFKTKEQAICAQKSHSVSRETNRERA